MLYTGFVAGEHYTHNGGGANYLCMHPEVRIMFKTFEIQCVYWTNPAMHLVFAYSLNFQKIMMIKTTTGIYCMERNIKIQGCWIRITTAMRLILHLNYNFVGLLTHSNIKFSIFFCRLALCASTNQRLLHMCNGGAQYAPMGIRRYTAVL